MGLFLEMDVSALSLQIVPSTEEKLGLPTVYQISCQTSKELEDKLEQLSIFHLIKADEYLSTPIAQDTTLAITNPVAILYDLSLGLLQLPELIKTYPNIPVICIVNDLIIQDSLLEELFSLGISDYIELDEVTDSSLKNTIQKAQYRNTVTSNTLTNNSALNLGATVQQTEQQNSMPPEQQNLLDEYSFQAELNALMSDVLSQSIDEKIYQVILEKAVKIIPRAQAGSMAILTDEGYHFVAAVGFDLEILASTYFNIQDLRPSSENSELSTHNYFDDDWYRMEDYKREIFERCGPSKEIKTSISIPILDGENIVVIFNIDNLESEDAFDNSAISIAKIFSTQIEALWQRIKLENNLFKEQKRLQNESSFRAELNSLMSDVLSQDNSEKVYQVMLEKAVDIIPHVHAGSMAVLTDYGYQFVAAVEFNLNALTSMTFNIEDFGHDSTWSQPTIKNYFDDEWYKLSTEKQEAFVNASTGKTVESSLTIPIINKGNIVILFNLDNFESKNAFDDTTISMGQMFATQIEAIWQRFELEKNIKANEQRYKKLFIDADRSKKELEILDELQHAISSKLELGELYTTVVKTIVKVFDFSGVTIGLVKGDTIVRGPTHDVNLENDPVVRKLDNSVAGRIVKTKKPELINNLSVHPDVRPEHASQQVSMIAIPFCAEQEVLGILYITNNQRTLKQSDLTLMQKVVDQLELAIENAQLHERVKTDLARSHALHNISDAIQQADNLKDLTQQIIETTRKAVGARWAILYKLNFNNQTIEHIVTSEVSKTPLQALTFEQLQNGLTGWAIQHQELVFIKKETDDHREHPDVKQARLELGFGSVIVAPLIYQNEALGVMALINHIDDVDYTDSDLQMVRQVSSQASIALAQHQLRQKIKYQAFHDVVTTLPNRFLFEDRLKQTLAHAERYNSKFAVLFLDLDGFKHINDTLGHDVGDLLLKKVSHRLKTIIRESDTLARMGGDEFAIILDQLNNHDDALRIAQTYQVALKDPFTIDKNSLFVSGSIGVSVYPSDGKDINTLLKHADTAMYEAKATGKNRVQAFNQVLADRSRERLELETHLRTAIQENSFELYYQPKIDIKSGQCIGTEALIRWIHPDLGFVSPEKFIPVAEDTGLIIPLGNWIIEEACQQTINWHQQGFRVTTAINIASVQFEHHLFVQNLKEILLKHDLAPQNIELEITESMVMQRVDIVINRLRELQDLGVSIAIDDFGTGHSSLSYLQKLPLDYLKIDRSFVDLMDKEDSQKNLVQTIISLAENFELEVIAEGVETAEQLELLKQMGCQTAQGYFFSKPVPANDATAFIKKLASSST